MSGDKKKIKIFVTHRIDKNSVCLENPLFVPIRCGAALDKDNVASIIQGDNTGDNISLKRLSYCELTTQYWAWKNEDLDYYGFCHYRRYFSFNEKPLVEDVWGNVVYNSLNEKAIKELCLDSLTVREKIEKYDVLIAKSWDLKTIKCKSVREHYNSADSLDIKHFDCMIEVINKKYPDFSNAAKKYSNGKILYSCNMFIMKKEVFCKYSEWLFDILGEVEKLIDTEYFSEEKLRTMGHLGERLAGIYYTYLLEQGTYRTTELQKALINNTDVEENIYPKFTSNQVPIVLAASDLFAPVLGVCLKSIINYTSEFNNYDIIIFNKEISKDNKSKILKLQENRNNISIRFFDVTRKVSEYDLSPNEHVGIETYYRFLIQDVMKHYDKVIYIDSDVIVKADLAELYHTNIDNKILAATHDADFIGQYSLKNGKVKSYCEKTLKLKEPYNYFQAGVLVLNITEMNKCFNVKELLEIAQKGIYKYMDQDILNIKCNNRIVYLNMKWNLLTDCARYRINNVIKFAPFNLYNEYLEARKSPKIIHYAGYLKPWYNAEEDMAEEFWRVAKQTDFYELLLYRMNTGAAWHIAHNMKRRIDFRADVLKYCYGIYTFLNPANTKRRKLFNKIYLKMRSS